MRPDCLRGRGESQSLSGYPDLSRKGIPNALSMINSESSSSRVSGISSSSHWRRSLSFPRPSFGSLRSWDWRYCRFLPLLSLPSPGLPPCISLLPALLLILSRSQLCLSQRISCCWFQSLCWFVASFYPIPTDFRT